jgi:DNA-binding MarR family transcriptional regulator
LLGADNNVTAFPENPGVPRLIGLVRAMRDCCQRQEGEMCDKLSLTASQFACLLAMPDTGELTIHQIGNVMGLSPSRASRITDSLVRGGLLDRKTMTHDRRQLQLTLTEKGRQKWQTAHMLLQECEQKLLKHMSGQNSRELEETFRTVIKAFTEGVRVEKVKKIRP